MKAQTLYVNGVLQIRYILTADHMDELSQQWRVVVVLMQ